MKLDYSTKYTDKKGSVIRKGVTNNGQSGFFRLERPNGSPITWEQYDSGSYYGGSWNYQNSRQQNIKKLDEGVNMAARKRKKSACGAKTKKTYKHTTKKAKTRRKPKKDFLDKLLSW